MDWNGENPMVLGIGYFDEEAAQRRAEQSARSMRWITQMMRGMTG